MKTVKMTINVPESFHTLIKTYSSLNGITIKDFIVKTITSSLQSDKTIKNVPNKETLEAFKETESGKLNIYNSIDGLFSKLDKIEESAKS